MDSRGLFGRIGLGGVVDDLTLADVNVTGTEAAGALVGENQGLLIGIQSSGQVSGELHVGGLVGLNLRLVYLSRSSATVTGMRPPFPPGVFIIVTFGPPAATGGLVGYNTGFVVYSYATGPVTSDSPAGGLVGYHQSKLISASYATGPVTGSPAGGLVGVIGTPFEEATIRASYATGSVDGSTAGGLVGRVYDDGIITASYATGRVAGSSNGGLVGDDEGGTITNSYWDTRTSGQGSGSPGSGRTTSQLQSPRSYSGIYGSWNVDIDEDNMNDDPWNFGTSSQYPALKADMDGDHDETWEEFGYQLRSGPTLTATATTNAGQSQVELEWTAVPLSSEWTPAPSVSYSVTREDDDSIEIIAENLTAREYTDTDVAGETYVYQVMAVVDGRRSRAQRHGIGDGGRQQTSGGGGHLAVANAARGRLSDDGAGRGVPGSGGRHHHLHRVLLGHHRRPGDPFGIAGDDHPGRRGPHDHHGDRYRRGVQPEQDSAVQGDGSAHHDG